MVEFYPRAPESPVQHASAFLLLSKELRQASGSQEMHLRTSKSRIIARGEWFCSSLHLGNSPLFLPRHAFLPFKARISIRTQFSDFKRSQGLQKVSRFNAEITFKMSVLIPWAELMLKWCFVLLKNF